MRFGKLPKKSSKTCTYIFGQLTQWFKHEPQTERALGYGYASSCSNHRDLPGRAFPACLSVDGALEPRALKNGEMTMKAQESRCVLQLTAPPPPPPFKCIRIRWRVFQDPALGDNDCVSWRRGVSKPYFAQVPGPFERACNLETTHRAGGQNPVSMESASLLQS